MDVQHAFDFECSEKQRDALRSALQPFGLPHWSVELIIMLARDGRPREIAGQQCYELELSKRKAATAMSCSPNTFSAAVADLQRRKCVEVVAFGQRRTYFLSRDRVNALAPIADDPIDELGLFSEPPEADQLRQLVSAGQRLVSAGQSARDRDTRTSLSRDRDTVTCNRVPTDQPSRPAARRGDGPSLRDLSDEQVRAMDIPALRSAFGDACQQGWLQDEREDKIKFLSACHHASKSPKINHPARVVYAAVKHYDFQRVNQASWDWAADFLRARERVDLENLR